MRRRSLDRIVLGLEVAMGVAAVTLGVLLLTAGRYGLGALSLVAFVSVAITVGRDIVRLRATNGTGAVGA
ncbi:hypothetical protein ACIQI8_13565 [Streptomyces sp. NPDC092369]|uniref:hypothetical protein n=1 Tax=Streptomyces sp. NPDC092369 TaxID=3366015 RepID=UPI003812E1EE